MNRSNYFNYIEEKLNLLAYRIDGRAKNNLLDLNIYSETLFAGIVNMLFGYELVNLNLTKRNIEGIDLIDNKNKIIVQVSSTCTKQKIESSLAKNLLQQYNDYRFKFISICKNKNSVNKNSVKNKVFNNPNNVLFDPNTDIIDIVSILNIVLSMEIDQQKAFYDFIRKELGDSVDVLKVDSNLATVINILASEDLSNDVESPEINSFEINKKISFNNLTLVRDTINEYKVYYSKLNEKYTEFDKQGVNKSLSVFRVIKNQYIKYSTDEKEAHRLFFAVVNGVIDLIMNSRNYIEIPYEELEMCAYIVVVDAFVRCKIFENPKGYKYVTS